MENEHPATQVVRRVGRWPDVSIVERSDGGSEFRLEGREIGHVHEGGRVDVCLTCELRDQVLTDGLADRHSPPHDRSWVSYLIRERSDVGGAIRLLRLAYLRRLLELRRADQSVATTVRPEREFWNLELSPDLRVLLGRSADPAAGRVTDSVRGGQPVSGALTPSDRSPAQSSDQSRARRFDPSGTPQSTDPGDLR